MSLRRLALIVLLLNFLSSTLFLVTVNRPVYDDANNFPDVHRYANEGLSIGTIRNHLNPAGPMGFLWMAAGVRLLGGDELRDARLTVLASWVLLAAGIFVGARFSSSPQLWYGALLASLVFPHAVEATATALTEGPALLFAVMGALAWTEFARHLKITPRLFLVGMLGGLAMGVAVTCRQYYLALLPAAAFFALYQWRSHKSADGWRWPASVISSLLLAALPVVLLIFVWRGISSPGMAAGTSYNHMWKATVGANFSRPMVVAFYTAAYLVPFTFPAMFRLKGSQRKIAAWIAVLGGVGIASISSLFLQPGPLNSLIGIASRLPYAGRLLFAAIAVAVLYNAAAVCCLLWEQRQALSECTPVVFALLVIAFFIAEQIGVGGNLPFYDRYVLQIAPFLGLIAFALLPKLTTSRLVVLACLSVLSHFMLWRFAFSG